MVILYLFSVLIPVITYYTYIVVFSLSYVQVRKNKDHNI